MTRTRSSRGGLGDRVDERVAQLGAEIALSLSGRLRSSRTPHGVASRRRTGSVAVTVGDLDDEGVDGDGPGGPAISGFRSTSTRSGRSTPSLAEGDDRRRRRRPGRRAGRPRTPSRIRRAAQLVEHRGGLVAVERREPDARRRRAPRRGCRRARRGRSARTAGRGGSPTISSTPGRAIGSTRRPRDRAPDGSGERQQVRPRRARTVASPPSPSRTPPMSRLVGEAVGVDLEGDRAAESAAAAGRRRRRRRRRRRGVDRQARRPRAARGSPAPSSAVVGGRPMAAAGVRLVARRRPVGGERRPAGPEGPVAPGAGRARPPRPRPRRSPGMPRAFRAGRGPRRPSSSDARRSPASARPRSARRRPAGGPVGPRVAPEERPIDLARRLDLRLQRPIREVVDEGEHVVRAGVGERIEGGAVGDRRVGRAPRVERVADVAQRRELGEELLAGGGRDGRQVDARSAARGRR